MIRKGQRKWTGGFFDMSLCLVVMKYSLSTLQKNVPSFEPKLFQEQMGELSLRNRHVIPSEEVVKTTKRI